jgi:twitching motility protein PilT
MTEGELGELLRATAAAVIAGEINPDDAVNAEAVARDVVAEPAQAEEISAPAVEIIEPMVVEPVVVEPPRPVATIAVEDHDAGLPLAAVAVDSQEPARIAAPDRHVARATEELPALVEYQIQRENIAAPAHAPVTEPAAAAEPPGEPEPVIVREPVVVLTATPIHGDPQPVSIDAAETTVTVIMNDEHEVTAASPGDGGQDDDVTTSRPAAVVLPLTRQSKGDAAGDARASVATTVQRLLRLAAARGAGTVYVVAHTAPLVRVDGEFSTLEGEPALSAAFVERLLAEVAPATRGASPSAEWLIDVPEIGRVRCVTFRDHRGPGVIFRMVPPRAIAAEQLGLSSEVQGLGSEADGLILITGARGSGKSTLLTSFVDLINQTRSDHIISIESQIGFVHEPKRSFISQREVRGEEALLSAVRSAVREEPDVLVIEDLRTQELTALALDAAESGRLVFASVPGLSIPAALERLIELFPADRREKVQAALASVLRGVVSQVLLRKLRGGRIAAREVLFNTPPVAAAIMEGKTFQLTAALESGRSAGMISFAESLASLVREGTVHPAHAYRKAPNGEQFLAALRRSGIDAAIAERLG